MSVAQEILAFSESRDPWQQDLLRRLVTKDEVNEGDLRQVLDLLKAQFALLEGTPPTPVPLSISHFTAPPSGAPSVILNSIGDLANVNRLASSQVLSFAVDGLTIIYGDNGSGKSGFCRLLKKLCRVREGGEEDVRGDVFDGAAGSRKAEATVRFTVSGAETTEIRWTTDSAPPTFLSRVSVFDSKAAALYADQQNRIEFLPHGLDVLTRLAEACDRLVAILDTERVQLEGRIQVALPLVAAGTPTSVFLGRLGKSCTEGDLPPHQAIESACEWTEAHTVGLREAERALIESPETLATGCRNVAQRIQTIEDELLAATLKLDDAAVDLNLQLWRAAQTARDAAVLAAGQVEANSFLPGFGSEPWRLLFKYAREYSTVAYPGEAFPVTWDGSRCLLCQQPLSQEAKDRFAAFDAYLMSIAEANAVQAELARDEARESLDRMSLR